MKKFFSFLVALLITNFVSAQTTDYTTAIDNFQRNYNTDNYQEIFNAFSPEMKKALPVEKTKAFLTNLKSQIGSLDSLEFLNYHQRSYGVYKAKFAKAVMAVNLSLDEQKQINGLFINPYEKSIATENKTTNLLSTYPKEIAEILFSKTKDLPNNAQLSIALLENGKTSYYGLTKMNDTIKPAENQGKLFEIGSITKVFTSTVLASLIENKKLKIKDEINAYYPFAFKDSIQLTFESLANHTSGLARLPENLDLSNQLNPYKDYGKTQIEAFLKSFLKLENEPSTKYAYSNIGAGLLGYTLGISQGTDFQTLLQKQVFDKYQMINSVTSPTNLGNNLVQGLNKKGEIVSNWDFDVLLAAGGILSTSEDLAKFTNAQFNPENKELELTRKTTFESKGDIKIGLGWHIIKSKNGKDLFWHNGGTGGYSSSIVMNIEDKSAVIVLSNVFDVNDKMDALSYNLLHTSKK